MIMCDILDLPADKQTTDDNKKQLIPKRILSGSAFQSALFLRIGPSLVLV